MQKLFFTVLFALVALAGGVLAQTFTLTQTYPNPTPKLDDRFGNAVAAVGNKILVGASLDDTLGFTSSGAAYLFGAASSTPLLTIISPNPATNALFGAAVAAFGDDLLIGAPGANKVYLFDGDTGGLLATFSNPEATANEFGFAIAVAGSNVLIGAPAFAVGIANNVGRAYLFDAGGDSLG
ncbi:MAG: FG-GAP repeat protein, partial [bacterium]